MLANQRLFLANSEINTLRKIRECDVPSLRKINPNIPSELDQIVQKALKKDKSQRYQTAAELSRDLQGFISRFDPDFSIQDFSSFVKGLFSEEIIEIRKKQIIYSQVTVASSSNNDFEKTVLTDTSSTVVDGISDISIKNIALDTITRSEKAQREIIRHKKVAGLDFSNAGIELTNTKTEGLELVKSKAHEKTRNYKQNTYTNTDQSMTKIKKSSDMTLLTVIFAISFMLVAIATLNQSNPQFKQFFCETLSSVGICNPQKSVAVDGLQVVSTPAGASVYVNRKPVGKTPIDINIKDFPSNIAVRKAGYKTQSKNISENPENGILNFNLRKVPTGILRVKSVGSEIYVNGYRVKSGDRVPVAANTKIEVRVVNPLNGLEKVEQVVVKPNVIRPIIISSPR
ncbi:MAG: PEGA domain-containing protein [Bdellovibrionales bacterium]|nr:PEGA domain-containing protein [Bdellovibrionales bacterium]